MANTLLTWDIIAPTALMEFTNNLQFAKTVNRQYQAQYSNKTGDTIRIYKPVRYDVRSGSQIDLQAITQRTDTLTIEHQDGVDIALTSKELSLELDDFRRTVLNPAMLRLANKVDQRLYTTSKDIYNYVGTAGTSPSTYEVISDAATKLDSLGIPESDRFIAMAPKDAGKLRSALYNTFNTKFNSDIILKGMMGELAGFDIYQAQNVIRPSVNDVSGGSFGTPLVNGASQTGSSLVLDGVTSGMTIYAGTVFQIAGVYALNPITRQSTGLLANFEVQEDATASGTDITLTISPAISLTGPYATVDSSPADNAAVTFQARHNINLAYHSEAFTAAFIDLWSPPANQNSGAYFDKLVDKDAGVSIRMARAYDINNDKYVVRFDILYGVKCFPEYATRIMGS